MIDQKISSVFQHHILSHMLKNKNLLRVKSCTHKNSNCFILYEAKQAIALRDLLVSHKNLSLSPILLLEANACLYAWHMYIKSV